MSMPRAAMSVATSTCSSPVLNSASALVRALWLLLPWIAIAVMPSLFRCSVRRFAPCFMRVNTSTWCQSFCLIRWHSRSFLASRPDRVDLLRDQLGGLVAARHLDQRRLVQQPVGQGLDLVAEGGREQQALLLRRHEREHLLDVVHEAHVEHAVGFVEHEDLDVAEVERALLRGGRAGGRAWPRGCRRRARRRSICGCMPTPPNITMLSSACMYLP